MNPRIDRAVVVALMLITALYLVLFGYYVGATALRVPVVDVIYWVTHYIDHWLSGDWWGYLWAAHNGHRLIWSRLLMIASLNWPGGSVLPFLLFGLACFVAMIGSLVLEILAADLPPAPRLAIALSMVLLLATSFNAIDCGAPQLGVYLHTAAFVVLALVLWDGKGEGDAHATGRRIGALAAGVASAFGVNGGIFIWPVLAWAAWRGDLGWRWIATSLLVGAALAAVYIPHMGQAHVISQLDGPTLLRIVDYVVRFFGLPWSHSPGLVDAARILGLATLIAGTYAILRFGFPGRPRSRLDRIAVGLLMFSFLTAAAITYGRLDTAPDREMPIRYALFTSLAQVGLLMLAAPWLCRLWVTLRMPLIQGVVLAGAILFVVQQVLSGQAGAEGVQQYTAAYRAYEAGNATIEQQHLVGSPDYVERVFAFLHAHALFLPEH